MSDYCHEKFISIRFRRYRNIAINSWEMSLSCQSSRNIPIWYALYQRSSTLHSSPHNLFFRRGKFPIFLYPVYSETIFYPLINAFNTYRKLCASATGPRHVKITSLKFQCKYSRVVDRPASNTSPLFFTSSPSKDANAESPVFDIIPTSRDSFVSMTMYNPRWLVWILITFPVYGTWISFSLHIPLCE